MNLTETAYQMPIGVLLHEAGKQFAMAEIVRDGWQQALYERGGWFLLLVHADRTAADLCREPGCHEPPISPVHAWCRAHDRRGGFAHA